MIPEEKQTLRAQVLESLRALGLEQRAEKSRLIRRNLRDLGGLVFGFAPLRLEPDWLSEWTGARMALPRIEGDGLVFYRVTEPARDLCMGQFGAREPFASDERRVLPSEAATVLVPGLGFDARGGRLGRGGGFYDRFLATPGLAARRIGVCFACQLVERVPLEAHDARMDAIVTEDGWIEAQNSAPGRD
jgi:5-formyltetrahydrofolate cyclo-ligase